MKLPTVIAAVRAHIADGQSVVLQLVTTAESILNRRLADLRPEERADLEIDLSPREYIIDYLERAFPTRQMQIFKDDTGTPRSLPMTDENGNPVYNPEAEEARAALIENDRKSVVTGKSDAVRVGLGGRRSRKNTNLHQYNTLPRHK